ncbi:MAG: glycosyltransferase [Anaerolineae bacterium]|nr:glycosyltransferase [Anaerolineae bacterium]
MKILTVLTYYRPHTSGLTIYAERLARAFARRGHEVTVMTTQYDKSLPREETMDGVRIIRVPVAVRISKGVISPTFVNVVVHFQNYMAGILSNHIVTYTQDYADHSPYLSRYRNKLTPILPPIKLPPPAEGAVEAFARTHETRVRRPVIGMATRFASEKGVEILVEALPAVLEKYPDAQVLYAGQHLNVIGEAEYYERLRPQIEKYEANGHWKFLGVLDPVQMAAYYPNLDALVVPSLNSTEAFGLVQVEAMLNGVPCIASALPGVRRPAQMHKMGEVVPIGDAPALAEALLKVLANRGAYRCDAAELAAMYDPESIAAEYEKLFAKLTRKS